MKNLRALVRNSRALYGLAGWLDGSFGLVNRNVLFPLLTKRLLEEKLKGVERLNIGCGTYTGKEWLNIGLYRERDVLYGTVKRSNGIQILNFDMTEDLPVPANSVKYVYASHFIEHLPMQDGMRVLRQCHKIMAKGGVIRLTFPDMELWIKNYYENNLDFFEKYRRIYLKGEKAMATTKGEIFMSQVHNWGHRWNYDFESIKHVLETVGFSNVVRKTHMNSQIPDIRDIEPSGEGRLLETAYVEATR